MDEPCEIGAGTRIWHFCHVTKGAVIGERCNLGQNVFVGATARIGNNVKIQNNVSVYDAVDLEDDVFCGPSCVFTNVINPRSQIVRHSQYLRTVVRRGATIGANATIVCGATVGRYAFIAAGAVVRGDVPDYALNDRRAGAAPRLDEPPRPPACQPRRRRRNGLPGKRLALPGSRAGRRALSGLAGRRAAGEIKNGTQIGLMIAD